MPAKRARCDVCGFRWRLRRDGTMQAHRLYSGSDRCEQPCAGSGRPPRPLRFLANGEPDCGECLEYFWSPRFPSVEAFASVSVENGRPVGAMARAMLMRYHDEDHQEEPGG